MAEVQLAFEKLAGRENYNNWKFGMRMALIHENLWKSIEGYQADDQSKESEKKRCDEKALAKICLMIKPIAYTHVRSAKTAKEAWDNLQKAYEDQGLSRRLSLIRRLVRIRLENYSTMEAYVNETLSIAQKLADMAQPVDDEFLGVIMLSGLTSEYDPMVMAIENSNVKITSDFVKARLMQDDKYGKDNKEKHETALFSKKKFQTKKNIKCFKCGLSGHYKNQCKKPDAEESRHKSQTETKNVKTEKALQTVLQRDESGDIQQNWYIDSGATAHMTFQRELLYDFQEKSESQVIVANNEKMSSEGEGKAKVKTTKGEKTITNIVYIPGLRANLLSVSKMVEKGHTVVFSSEGCHIYDSENFKATGEIVVTASNKNGLYKLDLTMEQAYLTNSTNFQDLWHKRLGHLNHYSMNLLKNGMATGVDYNYEKNEQCSICLLGKQSRKPFNKTGGKRAKELLELIHTDLCGPIPEKSWSGARYIFTLIDDYSRKIFAYFLKSKSEVFTVFKEFLVLVENQTGKRIKKIRSDNGTEYVNSTFEDFLKSKGIEHQLTVRYTPEQNGVAERTNRTIVEKARCLLQEANLDDKMWAEAINTAVYLKNRSPHKAVKDKTPEEKWTEEKVDLKHLKVFGCIAQAHVPVQLRQKLSAKSKQYIFVGYCEHTKGYRLFDIENPGQIIKSRDVVFFENQFNQKQSEKEERKETEFIKEEFIEIEDQNEVEDQNDEESEEEIIQQRRSERNKKTKEYEDYILYHSELLTDPCSFQEAMKSSEKLKWKEAMDEEYQSLVKNKVWELVERPKDRKIVQCKWVFTVKNDVNGEIKHKARLVARGFNQKYGEDFTETFSPVVRNSTVRLLFALSVNLNLEINHIDVTTAFLNSELIETIFMTQPEGYEINNKVCLLKKSIYGLKQSSRMWNKQVEKLLQKLGYKISLYEPCVFYKKISNSIVIIALYVDDFIIFSNNNEEKNLLIKVLSENFKIKDLGEIKKCLGLNITRDNIKHEIRINQKDYILKLLDKFSMAEAKTVSTPIEANLKLEKGLTCDETIPFRCLIGSLMFLAVNTRPDIAFAVSFMSQFNNCYESIHFKHAKRILKYLKGTINKELTFKKDSISVSAYTDADWGNDINDAKSYTGFIFKLGKSSFSWEAKKQHSVALSSTEAEYVAISQAAKEAIFIKGFLKELLDHSDTIIMYNDNQSAHKLVSNPVFHNRTKHINVKYHFIRENVEKGDIDLKYIPTNEMIADVLTKGLQSSKHNYFIQNMGLE